MLKLDEKFFNVSEPFVDNGKLYVNVKVKKRYIKTLKKIMKTILKLSKFFNYLGKDYIEIEESLEYVDISIKGKGEKGSATRNNN